MAENLVFSLTPAKKQIEESEEEWTRKDKVKLGFILKPCRKNQIICRPRTRRSFKITQWELVSGYNTIANIAKIEKQYYNESSFSFVKIVGFDDFLDFIRTSGFGEKIDGGYQIETRNLNEAKGIVRAFTELGYQGYYCGKELWED